MILYSPLAPPWRVSQYFGEHPEWYAPYGLAGHSGVDIPGEVGTPLHAGTFGRVYVTRTYAAGICVHINNPLGTLVYKHCQGAVGQMGRLVRVGEVIAMLGNSGAHTTGPHVHVEWIPVDTDYNNGYRGAVDPWPMLEDGLMELERAGELATEVRWTVEEQVVRTRERADKLRKEAAQKLIEADRLDREAWRAVQDLVNTTRGKLYAIEAALGLPVPAEWEE